MRNRFVLEICVESVDHAVAAERGGAQRIELCSDLFSGGITPSVGLMQTARRHVRLPIHILIRPRPGDFCYSDNEFEIMRDDIVAAKQLGMDGIVLGILHEDTRVDIERTRSLVAVAQPLPVTFHRAFDVPEDLDKSLEDVIQTGASRILTSGGQPRATDALPALSRLVQSAKGRILIMPCGGINSENVAHIVRTTRAQEVHSSAGTSSPGLTAHNSSLSDSNDSDASSPEFASFEQKVAKLAGLLGSVRHDEHVS
jgi:copper homeostasis protein